MAKGRIGWRRWWAVVVCVCLVGVLLVACRLAKDGVCSIPEVIVIVVLLEGIVLIPGGLASATKRQLARQVPRLCPNCGNDATYFAWKKCPQFGAPVSCPECDHDLTTGVRVSCPKCRTAWLCPGCGLRLKSERTAPCPICGVHHHCIRCGYDLTGNTSGRCSECGLRIE